MNCQPKRKINTRPISQLFLKELLGYNPETGAFHWLKTGTNAGSVKPRGYVVIQVKGSMYYAHRLAWLYMTGSLPKILIDHINRDKSDNRFENLREATESENAINRDRPLRYRDKDSGCEGVGWNKRRSKWEVFIKRNGVRVFFKRFSDIEEAKAAISNAKQFI